MLDLCTCGALYFAFFFLLFSVCLFASSSFVDVRMGRGATKKRNRREEEAEGRGKVEGGEQAGVWLTRIGSECGGDLSLEVEDATRQRRNEENNSRSAR